MGAIAGLFLGSNSVITAALSQLVNARISVPVWIPICGAVIVCIFRELPIKFHGGKTAASVTLNVTSIVILLLALAAAFLGTTVNGVFVHVAIGIMRMLLGSGMF